MSNYCPNRISGCISIRCMPSAQPMWGLLSGQYSVAPLQVGAVTDNVSGTQASLSQSPIRLERAAAHLLNFFVHAPSQFNKPMK